MSTSELENRSITVPMRKSVENLVITSQDVIGHSISQAITLSGVIAQHTNQITQELRNVSRPPSPNPRAESGPESIDNERLLEPPVLLRALSQPAPDALSVSSSSDVSLNALPSLRLDNPKGSSPNPSSSRVAEGAVPRAKKKSWYNALYPTYKSKADDFKRLFKDIPDDERLIVDYSCALLKDVLVHGRLYASQNYLCFYASIFSWETTMSLRWKDVTAITKEKTALVIPNAILVCTEGEKNFLTSFAGRDKAYLMLFRIWQNALMDQPVSSQEIWQWVHTCYGEELGFNSDDEGYSRELDEAPGSGHPEELSESGMETSGAGAERGGGPRSAPLRPDRDASPPLVSNGDAEYREEEGGDTLPTDMSDTTDSEPDKPHDNGQAEKCTAEHDGKLYLQQEFPFSPDQLFTMIFTNSSFSVELLAARGIRDYAQAPWQTLAGLRCRQVNYTQQITSGVLGPKEVHVTERQVINKCSKTGVLYSINATSDNAGIPYADYFSVEVHYCLQRLTDTSTRLSVFGNILYKKKMLSLVKGFVEKNTVEGLSEFTRLLEERLLGEAGPAPAQRVRRRRRPQSAQESIVSTVAMSPAAVLAPRAASRGSHGWVLATLVVLLLINAVLCWMLYHAERQHPTIDIEELQNRMSSLTGNQAGEWARLLEQHTLRQRGQLLAWRDALQRATDHLAQTEQALMKLLETIKPSLERAQREAPRDDL